MASKNEIIHIEFQANAGKANAAINALRSEASRAKDEVVRLTQELQQKKAANYPLEAIQALEGDLRRAKTEHRQWQSALENNLKGVRALDEAIKMFNSDINGGKGSVEGMNAALSKTALNAAKLQKSRSKEGEQTWNEMVALSKALEQNILRCNTATNHLVSTIKNGGTASRATLTQAKSDLQQMVALENEGTNAWKKYSSQLKVIEGALTKMNVEQQQVAGKNVLSQVFKGDYITKSRSELEQMISKLREYQSVIADPEGKGARHFKATETAIARLSAQLDKTKVSAGAVGKALETASLAGTANRFGSGLASEATKVAKAYGAVSANLAQLKQQRETYTILQQNGISLNAQEVAMLAKLDAEIATTTARQDKLRTEMIKTHEAQNLTTKDISESIAVLRQQQETVAEGSAAWLKYEAAIGELETKMKIMKGEAISLRDAMRLSSKAGGAGFTGTAQQLQLAEQAIKKAMSTATKGSAEWLKYQQALAKVRVEMQNATMTSERMQAIISKPVNARNINELSAAVKRAKAELELMANTVGTNSIQYAKFAEQTKKAEIQLKQLQAQSHGTASAFDKAMSRIKTYVTIYVGAAVAIQKIVSSLSDLMDLSDKMGEVRKTTGFTADEVGRLTENLKKMDTRTTINGLLDLSVAAGQLGLKTEEDVQGFTEAANKLMVALPEMGKEGATQMLKVALATGEIAKINKQMQDGLIEGSSATAVAMEKVGSTIDRLRATSAATAPAITDFVKRVGAVGAQSGVSIDQVAALGSTVDALGMRVEMSATALSRMIPAIRNNAFAVAKAIKVEPNTLRNLFETGRGMEAILMIFQHIKDTGMGADSIEKMLGLGGMQEVMKELNQMGARAGIVFSGLSQNVDELRRQLGVAKDAYEENVAIQQEYDKMNETAAAKWERLKNEMEEYFVGDSSQRFLGNIIEGLRTIVNIITGNVTPALQKLHAVLWACVAAWGTLSMGLGEAMWSKLVVAVTALKNAFVALFTVKGLTSLKDSLHFLALETKSYIALKWQLVTAHEAEEKAAIKAKLANNSLAKSLNANIILAVVAAVGMLIYKLSTMKSATEELDEAWIKLQTDEEAAERDINRLASTMKGTSKTVEETTKKHDELEKQTEDLRKEVDEMNKTTNLSAYAQDSLREKTEKLKKSEDDLKKATDDMNKAKKEHNTVIAEINSKYSKYLGYMLSEVTNAQLVESAHWRIVSALRAELEQKRLLENQNAIESKYGEDIKEWTKDSRDELDILPRDVQDQIMRRRSNLMAQVSYNIQKKVGKDGKEYTESKYVVPSISGIGNKAQQFNTEEETRNYLKQLLATIIKQETIDKGISLGTEYKTVREKGDYLGTTKTKTVKTGRAITAEEFVNKIWGGAYGSMSLDDGFQRLMSAELLRMQDQARQRYQDEGAVEGANTQANKATLNDIKANAADIAKTVKDNKQFTDKQIGELGRELNAIVQSSLKYGGNQADVEIYFGKGNDITVDNAAKKMLAKLDPKIREQVIKAAQQAQKAGTGGTVNPTYIPESNVWGSSQEPESTDWKNMNADQLVARRKQMNEFVKSIQTDTDVKKVLAEDAALMKAFQGRQATMREVIEWYNTERLKIQDELHARHLTNTGDWQDPKKQKARQKQFTDEMKAMLEELDAYYTERNQKIQDARNKDEITEGEAWRRTIKNETEWYNRRAELQKLYANKGSEVTAEEQQAIFNIIAEKTGDTAGFIKRSVENTVKFAQEVRKKDQKGEVEYRKWMADLMLGVEKDYLKSAKSIGKQVKFIEETLAKERPYDSITKNLQDNLDKMGILAVRYKRINDELEAQGKEKKYSDARIKAATYDEMAFYLKNAADAWSIDIDELLRRMAQEGMTVTAEEISKSDMLKQAVMGQLRKTFEEVQNAIKKEASQIKKDVDIIWNDDSQGPGGTSMKAAFEKAISQLGMQQDSVSRANSLIGAGFASENVAARLAMKQIEMQMRMQKTQFDMFRVQAAQRIKALTQEAKEHERIAEIMAKEGQLDEAKKERLMATNALQDAENVKKALGLTLSQETKEQEKQKTELLKLQEESQARLYKELQEWVSLMTKGLQGVFEAANFYNSSDYNNLAVARAGGSFNKTTTTTVTNSSSSTTKNTSTSKHTSTGASQTTSSKKTEQGSTAAKESQSKSSTSKNSASNTDTHTTSTTTGTKTSTSTREKQVDYYIIENAGTKDAEATQVSMTEEEYYEKKIELDRDNAIKEAWKNLLDDLNMKISETITDQINRMFQDAAINANTDASNLNTEALKLNTEGEQQLTAALKELATTEALKVAREANDFSAAYQEGGNGRTLGTGDMGVDENGVPNALKEPGAEGPVIPKAPWQMTEEERAQAQEGMATLWNSYAEYGTAAMQNMSDATAEMPSIVTNPSYMMTEEQREVAAGNNASLQQQLTEQEITNANLKADGIIAASDRERDAVIANEKQKSQATTSSNNQNTKSTQAAMAKMTLATNMYGLAYQTMSNDNMNATQKFLMFSVQAAGQAAIAMLTTDMATQEGKSKVELPGILGKAASQLGPIAGPIAFGAMMALLGGLMGMAVSAVSKSKSEIAQATGASTSGNAKSISAGKLMTGMLTYGEGNVNEFTDPSSLTPGRSYNVDSADGRTYRAKYMGVGAKTHLTNGPEFHLVGERGREAIIDAHTTRLLQMDDTGIWQAIQTLYNGGSLRHSVMRRKGRGMAAFADGNIDEFETMADGGGLMAGGAGFSPEQMMALQASIDRQSDLLERAMTDGIHAYFDVFGRGGLIDSYDTGKKTVTSHGEKY